MIISLPEFRTKFQSEEVVEHFREKVAERSKAHKYVALTAGRHVVADKLGEKIDVVSEGSTREILFYGYSIDPVRDNVGTPIGFNESVQSEPVIRVRLRRMPCRQGTAVQVTVLDESYRTEAVFLTEHLVEASKSEEKAESAERPVQKLEDVVTAAIAENPAIGKGCSSKVYEQIFRYFEAMGIDRIDYTGIALAAGVKDSAVRKQYQRYLERKDDESHKV